MRFANLDGSMIDVYQAATQMTDESGQTYPTTINTLLDNALGAPGLLRRLHRQHAHRQARRPGSDAIVASAQATGVPVVSARQMLTWLDGRNQSSFESVNWAGNKLTFTIAPGEGAVGLRAMLPISSAAGDLDWVKRGGEPVATHIETIKGIEYAFLDATAGQYTASYGPELTSTVPASPANDFSPKVFGSAPAGSTVRLYTSGDCSGSPAATASAAELAGGVTVAVPADSTTQIRATATPAGGSPSPCSDPLTYTEDSTPPATQIDTHPAAITSSTTATFTFSGSDPGGSGVASFECKLDSGSFAPCSSPRELSGLGDGSHTFEVRAVDQAGNTDASPAAFTWTVDTTGPEPRSAFILAPLRAPPRPNSNSRAATAARASPPSNASSTPDRGARAPRRRN